MAETSFEWIRERVRAHEPTLAERDGHLEAAVALVMHAPAGAPPELLFIQRAKHDRDPWSGQMAFPGGRRDSGDPDLATTATRETLEEVGVELGAPIGRLDDFSGTRNPRIAPLIVAPYVYQLDERPALTPNYEVRSTVWVPVPWMADPASAVQYEFERDRVSGTFPGFTYDGYTVWGLTYRVLANFFEILDLELPSDQGRRVRDDNSK